MYVYSLCRQLCHDKLPVQPVERLGDGADGEVLSIKDQPDKVIKLCVIYDHPARELKEYQQIQQVLDYIMNAQPPAYVRVYKHGYLGTYSRQIYKVPNKCEKQEFLLYYYIMEKLYKITEDEKKVFHSIISHEDRGIEKNYSPEKVNEMLQGMSRGLDFDVEKVRVFYYNLRQAHVLHRDLHVRNIMKNATGDFKLVDCDRITISKAESQRL
jgi:serine/threonine protein kinase